MSKMLTGASHVAELAPINLRQLPLAAQKGNLSCLVAGLPNEGGLSSLRWISRIKCKVPYRVGKCFTKVAVEHLERIQPFAPNVAHAFLL